MGLLPQIVTMYGIFYLHERWKNGRIQGEMSEMLVKTP